MCCCKKILRFCSVGSCLEDEIDFGIQAKHDGVHQLKTTFKGTEFVIEKEFAIDDQITFPTKDLNENYEFQAQLFDPNGVQILIEKDEVQYDCFEFKTKMSYAI